MKQDKFEPYLESLFVQPSVPASLEPVEVIQLLGKPQTSRRAHSKVVNIAAAVMLVSVLAVLGVYALHRKSLADKPDASLVGADETVLTQAEEDPMVMQADLTLDDAAEKKEAADTPSTKPGCLSGCTEDQCLPTCPNYTGEEA